MRKMFTKCVIYSRFSPRPRKYDADGNEIPCDSGDNQEADCRAHAAANGYQILGVFRDEYVSGDTELANRAGLSAAFQMLGRGVVLLVFKQSRLTRDAYLAEMLRRQVEKMDSIIQYVDGLQGETHEMKLARGVIALVDEYSKGINGLLTSWGMRRNQASGRRQSDQLPYGWRDDEAGPRTIEGRCIRMVPDSTEQAVISKILAMKAKGLGSMRIKRMLEADGVLCRGRETWNRKTLEAIIRRGRTNA